MRATRDKLPLPAPASHDSLVCRFLMAGTWKSEHPGSPRALQEAWPFGAYQRRFSVGPLFRVLPSTRRASVSRRGDMALLCFALGREAFDRMRLGKQGVWTPRPAGHPPD